MTATSIPAWQHTGTVVQACSCNWGFPYDFNAPPSQGFCEGTWTWHIEQVRYGEVTLDGLRFVAACRWPGALHEGNGEALPILDDRATPEQQEAIGVLLSGQAGGPWEIVATTLSRVLEPQVVHWEVQLDGENTVIRAGDVLTMQLAPLTNPVTGERHEAIAGLPTGFMSKEMHKTTTSQFAVRDGLRYDYSGQDAAWGRFEYRGGR